jgi:glycosyltransferase involved in cell wall biosynthesis
VQISVIIPTYNRTNDLERCLRSVLAQSISPTEVIVIDNGYIYETRKTVEKKESLFSSRGIKLKYIKNNENSLTVAKNMGILHSSGDIISFLDDDLILDRNYYKEIIKVYNEKPNALGVQGYNCSERKGKGVIASFGRAFIKLFQISSFQEEYKCRLLPSICVTSPYPNIKKIISCEWLSGASTYKRSILEEIKSDENLKKYGWNEDQDLSYRIFKKHPGSLFLTPYAKYWHEGTKSGRLPNKELIYMAEVYDLYLFYKVIDQNFKNKLIYLRSRMGRIALKVALILKRSGSKPTEIKHVIEAPFYCIKHIKEIKKGDLRFFNETLK